MMQHTHTIALEGLAFYAYHGFFEEEQRLGNHYQVDITLETDFSEAGRQDDLAHTVDYGVLYQIIADTMQTPAKLLEHIAQKIVNQVFERFETVKMVEVCIGKQNPPLGGLCAWAKIRIKSVRP